MVDGLGLRYDMYVYGYPIPHPGRYFVLDALPNGFAGGLLAVLFASAMSVFSGNVNAIATCFVLDGRSCLGQPELDGPATGIRVGIHTTDHRYL